MPSDIGAVALPASIGHIGVVVEDIDKTMEFLSSIWGLGPWQIIEEYTPSKDDIMVGEPFTLKVAHANLGPIMLELLQPLAGRSIWSQFLQTNGEGIHHIAFSLSNWDEMVSHLQKQGGEMIAGAITPWGKRWCYFDTKPGGIIVEFVEK